MKETCVTHLLLIHSFSSVVQELTCWSLSVSNIRLPRLTCRQKDTPFTWCRHWPAVQCLHCFTQQRKRKSNLTKNNNKYKSILLIISSTQTGDCNIYKKIIINMSLSPLFVVCIIFYIFMFVSSYVGHCFCGSGEKRYTESEWDKSCSFLKLTVKLEGRLDNTKSIIIDIWKSIHIARVKNAA